MLANPFTELATALSTDYVFTNFSLIMLMSMAAAMMPLILCLKYRHSPGAGALAQLMVGLLIWTATDILQIAGSQLEAKVFWARISYAGIVAIPVSWLLLSFSLKFRGVKFPPKLLAALSIIPSFILFLALTNSPGNGAAGHGLLWKDIAIRTPAGGAPLSVIRGFGFWVNVAYAYILLLAGSWMMLNTVAKQSGIYSSQGKLLILGVAAPWLSNFLFLSGLVPTGGIDPTPIAFTVSGLAFSWAVFRHKLLTLIPLARDMVMDQIKDGVVVLDASERVVDINPAAARILKVDDGGLVGRSIHAILKKSIDFPLDNNETGEMLTISSGEAGDKREYSVQASWLEDNNGRRKQIGMILMFHDITEFRKNVLLQKENEQRLNTLINSLPAGVILVRADTFEVTMINEVATKMIGREKDEVIGKKCKSFICPAVNSCPVIDQGEKIINSERKVIGSDGKMIPVLKSVSRIELDGWEYLLENFVDISALKEAEAVIKRSRDMLEDQLTQSDKLASIGQLAAGVAHEINNPIGYIMSNVGTLTDYVGVLSKLVKQYESLGEAVSGRNDDSIAPLISEIDKTREDEDLEFILGDIDQLLSESKQGAEQVRDIVQNLKCFARVDETESKPANINDGIEATLKVVWNELKYNCEVIKELNPLPDIKCNPGELNQVFMNLLVNASHSIPEKGTIRITTEDAGPEILVGISDTGDGIPKENLRNIFDPFFTTKDVGKGTGLGLSISHGIIKKHNGEITVESELGKGTTFTIRLPVERDSDNE